MLRTVLGLETFLQPANGVATGSVFRDGMRTHALKRSQSSHPGSIVAGDTAPAQSRDDRGQGFDLAAGCGICRDIFLSIERLFCAVQSGGAIGFAGREVPRFLAPEMLDEAEASAERRRRFAIRQSNVTRTAAKLREAIIGAMLWVQTRPK